MSGRLVHDHQQEGADQDGQGFPLPFGRRRSLLGHPVPAGELSSPYGRPTGPKGPDPDGVSTFRTHQTRPGRAPSIARGRWCSSRPTTIIGLRLSHPSDLSLRPATTTHPCEAPLSRAINEGSSDSPVRSSPRRWPLDGTGALGLSPGLRTPRSLAAHARAGTDHRARTRNLLYDISRTSNLADLLCACDPASHSWIGKRGRCRCGPGLRPAPDRRGWSRGSVGSASDRPVHMSDDPRAQLTASKTRPPTSYALSPQPSDPYETVPAPMRASEAEIGVLSSSHFLLVDFSPAQRTWP